MERSSECGTLAWTADYCISVWEDFAWQCKLRPFQSFMISTRARNMKKAVRKNYLTPWNSMIRQWPVISGSQRSPSPGTIWNDFSALFLSKCYNLLKPGTAREARWIMPVAGPIDCSLELGLQGVEYPPQSCSPHELVPLLRDMLHAFSGTASERQTVCNRRFCKSGHWLAWSWSLNFRWWESGVPGWLQ